MAARLTQLDILNLLSILDDKPIEVQHAEKLVKRGLCYFEGDEVFVSAEGATALKRAGFDHGAMKAGLRKISPREQSFAGYNFTSGKETRVKREYINTSSPGDYGADPVGDGTFRMVPSGDIVDFDERNRRLKKK